MLYYIPAFECLLTESELKMALDGNRLYCGEYTEVRDEDIRNRTDESLLSEISPYDDTCGNIPYIGSTPIDSTMRKAWLIEGISTGIYQYRRNKLRDEIYRAEERFESLDNQLNNLNRMLSHTMAIDGKDTDEITTTSIDSRIIKFIREKEGNVGLLLRYLKDLYLAMYREIDESLSMK